MRSHHYLTTIRTRAVPLDSAVVLDSCWNLDGQSLARAFKYGIQAKMAESWPPVAGPSVNIIYAVVSVQFGCFSVYIIPGDRPAMIPEYPSPQKPTKFVPSLSFKKAFESPPLSITQTIAVT